MNDKEKNTDNSGDIDEILRILDEYKEKSEAESKENEATPEVTEAPSTDEDVPESVDASPTEQIPEREIPQHGHFTETIDAVKAESANSMLSHFSVGDDDTTEVGTPKSDELTPIPKDFKKKKKKKKKKYDDSSKGVVASSLFKALMYIIFVLVASAYCAYYIIEIANDVFAFEKPDTEYVLNVGEGLTTQELSETLSEYGIVDYPAIFRLYVKYKLKVGEAAYNVGEYTISANMNYDEIVKKLTTTVVERVQVTVTIPEGYTTEQIINLFLEKGIGTRSGFVDVINNYPFKHEFVSKLETLELSPDRDYRLDGYLFPDTYFFYQDEKEVNVINKLLNNFVNKFEDEYYARCEKLGYSFDEIITLASMIQAEAKLAIDFEYISSVFHNRLESSGFDYLESDATVQYCLHDRNEDLTQADLDTNNPYNTYRFKGLPPGAICNPGIDAIISAMYPDDPLDSSGKSYTAYYFVSNKYGNTYYASTLKKHNQNIAEVKKDNEAYLAAQKPEEESTGE